MAVELLLETYSLGGVLVVLTFCLQCGAEIEGQSEKEEGRCGVCDEIIARLGRAEKKKAQAEAVIEECWRELKNREIDAKKKMKV